MAFISWRQSLLLFLLFACIATILLAPIASNTFIPLNYDTTNHLAAIIQAKLALAEGQFPLRTAPLEQQGWLYPYYQFYSSTSYLFAGFLHRFISNPFIVYKYCVWLALVIGGIYLYRVAYWFIQSRPAAILASIVYLMSPYYIVVINPMAAFNEAIALGILPMVLFYSLQKFYFPRKNSLFLITALAWFLLATVHLITFFYFSLFFALFLLLISFKHHWKNLIGVGIAYLFGLVLAMWQLAPIVLFGKKLEMAEGVNAFSIQPLSQLFSPSVNISRGIIASIEALHPGIGLPMLVAFGICIYAFINKLNTNNSENSWMILPLFILFSFILFITWTPINFWEWLPKELKIAQYSWRFLGQTLWIGALLFAWAVCWLFNNKLHVTHVVIGVLILVSATSAWLTCSEMSFTPLEKVTKKPFLILNANSYLIDAEKNPFLINKIDHANHLIHDEKNPTLKLDTPIYIGHFLATATDTPYMSLTGKIPKNARGTLTAVVNNTIISRYPLKPGALHWTFPLIKAKGAFTLQFKLMQNTKSALNIPIEDIAITHLLKSPDTLNVQTVQPHCTHVKQKTLCKLLVPTSTRLLELPAIYYPDMLRITLNNRVVPYSSVLYGTTLLAAIVPDAGKTNEISIEFQGLPWANFMSATSWYLWLFFFVYLVLRRVFYA